MNNATEQDSPYDGLEHFSTRELLAGINEEDHQVAAAIERARPALEALINAIEPRMQQGGRLFYIGSGTSGRLGILDASECPPTYGVPHALVIGLIAGGDAAIRTAQEGAEDDPNGAWRDLQAYQPSARDSLIGLSASGRTPYVIGGVRAANEAGLLTGCITCNEQTPLAAEAAYPVEIVTGPEFVTGSTRMKAGTAQKMALNMISTTLMIHLGHVKGNRMIDMKLTNTKLIDRGTRYLAQATGWDYATAREELLQHGSLRAALAANGVE
jgi:N-acetylmuramic acid 6-phosphate etherase